MKTSIFRMFEWLLLAMAFFWLSLNTPFLADGHGLSIAQISAIQTLNWKLGCVASGVFLGYWADRIVLGRLLDADSDLRRIARAIVVLACVSGVSGGV